MDLRHAFVETVASHGDQPRIFAGDDGFSYPQLAVGVVAMNDLLRAVDQSETGAVGLLMPNTHAFIPAFYGAMFAGKIPTPMNPLAPPPELAAMIQSVGIRTVLTVSPLRPLIEGLEQAGLQSIQAFYLDEMAAQLDDAGRKALAERCNPARLGEMLSEEIPDTACMLFSSGTTGMPKAVMLTHDNLLSNNHAIDQIFQIDDENDVLLCVLPFFHSFGLMTLHLTLIGGKGRLVCMPRFAPGDVLAAIEKHKATVILLVPQMWGLLIRAARKKPADFSSLRICVTGGGPPTDELRKAWHAVSGKKLHTGYGLTEFSPVVGAEVEGAERKGSIGKPLPGVEVHIADDDGQILATGEEGEIWLRGPEVMKGYFNNPEATKEAVDAEGWLHTGDFGKLDEDGFLFICGRKKDIIIVAGENVHPQEIEEALESHPDVAEGAVIGAPDPTRGEVPKGFVVPLPDTEIDPQEVRAFLRDLLAPYKVPKEIVVMEELPKNAMGKLLRRELKS